MDYENQVNRLSDRLEIASQSQKLVEMVDREILKTTFHFRARSFVKSLIRQRQLICDRQASIKNPYRMLTLIDRLRDNLNSCPEKDFSMAKFFLIHEDDIRAIIPGKFPSKRHTDFIHFREQARNIRNRQLSML